MHLGQIVAQGHVGLALQCQRERGGADVGVAVAVAANPLAHAQKAGDVLVAQLALKLFVDARNLAQKGVFVVRERVLDLVGHGELGIAQQPRLPQLGHARAQLRLVGGQLARRDRVLRAVVELRSGNDFVAGHQQIGNLALGIQNALALHLGRVGGEHRRHIALGKRLRHRARRNARPTQTRQRHLDAALLRAARAFVHGAAADVVAVFGQIGQVTEIGERANHAHRLVARQALEQLLERLVRFLVGISAEGNRQLADLFDQVIGRHALLLADHIAQDAAQQPDVLDERQILVSLAGGGCGGGGFGLAGRRGHTKGFS
ncbi:hypothetical protein SDC9_121802 [bioreactor metagenome]|uniref:Uncharacterized protein n=1 Tax=bioreactor metagenome TaxID=1076179 RepID=A0A645CD29_9ZZZZ